nr:MAG TPA: hypothetical protein [Caudoviricetes sp.]DAV68360.1 MAG TPA: hypothetical protein [Caudoviricetes sp.]
MVVVGSMSVSKTASMCALVPAFATYFLSKISN